MPFSKHLYLQDEGVVFMVNGKNITFKGSLTIVSADNPASALLGGFKQSASAFKYCRHCNGTSSDVQSKVCLMSTNNEVQSWLIFAQVQICVLQIRILEC